ncbi:MAG TPA: PAS domain S-box protein, partial [Syntrophorhabdales bacterium]|nr:PAS domain S-box protein [Syntrophorhabdales bacterium]
MGKKPTRQTLQHAAHPPEKSKREYHQAHDPLELKRAQNELHAHLTFFQNMDRINRALQGTNDLEQVMRDVLDIMLSIFECDRILLVYPCDPDAPSFEAVIERSRPDYQTLGVVSMNQDLAKHFRAIGSSSGPVTFGPAGDYPLEGEARHFRSGIALALYPKTGKPWSLGLYQCSYPRAWTQDERNLLEEIARRMGDVLTSLLAHRDLQESEERHRVTLQKAMDGFLRADRQGRILEVNEACCRISGYSERELLSMNVADLSPVLTAERIAAIVRGLAETGPNRFEIIGRRKDGSLVDAEVSAQYQPLAGDQVVVFVRDMTTQKRAEEALRDSEERFRGIAGNLPGIVYQYYARDNGERGMYYVNERAEHVFGVSVDPLNTWYERFEA